MTRISSNVSGTSGFDYVQDTQPSLPGEGETWYDTSADEAYVYDGSTFLEMSVTGHSELGGVVADNHHARYTDEEAQDAVGTILGSELTYDDAGNAITVADPRVDITENGNAVGTDVATIDFRTYMDVSDAGGGTIQVSAQNPSVQDNVTSVNNVGDIFFGTNLGVTDDGDGTVTVNAEGEATSDTRVNVSDNGATVVSDTQDINFANNLSVTDDGSGTVSVDAPSGYSDEDAQDAVGTIMSGGNAISVTYDDANDTITTAVDESGISHDNISGVSASDHHSRYTDSEARTAVDGSNVSLDHANLSGVGANDHHSRYTDSEARNALPFNYEKDGSISQSDVSSITYNLSDTYGQVAIWFKNFENVKSGSQRIGITVEGITDNYKIVSQDNSAGGVNDLWLVDNGNFGAGDHLRGTLTISGSWNEGPVFSGDLGATSYSRRALLNGAVEADVSSKSPLSTFDLHGSSGPITVEAEVFGRGSP
jgi:hypothetical protein